jgi:RNA polymerase sigma factor (sigma-70 family)
VKTVPAPRSPAGLRDASDDRLVALARDGSDPAFEQIVTRYRAPLERHCARMLDPHRAEDVVQHAFVKALLHIRDTNRPLQLRAWLYRVAHNAALNTMARGGYDWDELDESYDGVAQPPTMAAQRERVDGLVRDIQNLPERQREALVQSAFEGRPYSDIAADLGISDTAVRALLARARRHLRAGLGALLIPLRPLRDWARASASPGGGLQRMGEALAQSAPAGGLERIGATVLVAGAVTAATPTIFDGHETVKASAPPADAAARAPGTARAEAAVKVAARASAVRTGQAGGQEQVAVRPPATDPLAEGEAEEPTPEPTRSLMPAGGTSPEEEAWSPDHLETAEDPDPTGRAVDEEAEVSTGEPSTGVDAEPPAEPPSDPDPSEAAPPEQP